VLSVKPRVTEQQFRAACCTARTDYKRGVAVDPLEDALEKHPHDPDIQAIQRVCNVHDVPLATNAAAFNLIIAGETA
jgi:methylglyoxal synthase